MFELRLISNRISNKIIYTIWLKFEYRVSRDDLRVLLMRFRDKVRKSWI